MIPVLVSAIITMVLLYALDAWVHQKIDGVEVAATFAAAFVLGSLFVAVWVGVR